MGTEGMKLLGRDDILNANDRDIERVHVPEWGGDVCYRQISGLEREQWEAEAPTRDPKTGKLDGEYGFVRARLLVYALCDEEGTPLFTTEDIMALSQKSAAGLDRVYALVAEMNKVSDADIDEIEGN
jgi:hypothetical protein